MLHLLLSVTIGRFVFGPTANLPDVEEQMIDLLNTPDQWPGTLNLLHASSGCIHFRGPTVLGKMTAAHQETVARQSARLGLSVSIEAGGALCSGQHPPGNVGVSRASAMLGALAPYFSAGGALDIWGLESVFSVTHKNCPEQDPRTTVVELAAYAATVSRSLPGIQLYLYDALSHFTVRRADGNGTWPANVPVGSPSHTGLELGEALMMLREGLAQRNVSLHGYWADCPFECSANYSSDLHRELDGFARLADAVTLVKGLGFHMGKTFNSHLGGAAADEAFFYNTSSDFARASAAVPGGARAFDLLAVETWYPFPARPQPEHVPFTTSYTARSIFQAASGSAASTL